MNWHAHAGGKCVCVKKGLGENWLTGLDPRVYPVNVFIKHQAATGYGLFSELLSTCMAQADAKKKKKKLKWCI